MVDTRRFEEEDEAGSGGGRFVPLELIEGDDADNDLTGTPQADEIFGLGGADTIIGRGGGDEIDAGPGDDVARGGPGRDVIRGEDGNDTINGGKGGDRLSGGLGDDTMRGQSGADVMDGDDGNDTMAGGNRNDTLRGGLGNDTMSGGGGDDSLAGGRGADDIDGGNGNDVLTGSRDGDDLSGGKGDDLLRGGGGDDELAGNAGNDRLLGGGGDDVLDGGRGFDEMTGGAGADTYAFSQMDGTTDAIFGFDIAEDTLDLSRILNFEAGDRIQRFVRFRSVEQGTELQVDPDGERDFQLIGGLFDVDLTLDDFSLAQLGLAGGGGGGTIDDAVVASSNLAGVVGNGTSFLPSISNDGQFVTFTSSSTNLIANDDNADIFDVFRKDLSSGEVVRLSEVQVPGVGLTGADDGSFGSAVADGGRVAFASDADNLGGTDSAVTDVYVNDGPGGAPELVSIPGNQFAGDPSITADGNLVAFQAVATGRAGTDDPADGTQAPRIFVRNLVTDELEDASTFSSDPNDFADEASFDPEIAADGGFVVFESDATNFLGAGDGADVNGQRDIYRKNLGTGDIELVSVTEDGIQGFGGSTDASVSADGRFVAFQSSATFSIADADDQSIDIYVKDMQDGDIQLVTINQAGVRANGDSFTPSISDDGRFVAFRSEATNLLGAGNDTNDRPDIFVADLETGAFLRFDMGGDTSGVLLEDLVEPVLSGDGGLVAFLTDVAVGGDGGVESSQVTVAPVDFGGAAPAAVAGIDTLLTPADTVA